MLSTNYRDDFKAKINEVLKFAYENEFSDFYKKRLINKKTPQIESYADFQKLPFLLKNEFLAVDLDQRTFVAKDDITHYSFSSGTSSHNRPTVIPRTTLSYNDKSFSKEERVKYIFEEEKLVKLGVKNILLMMPPLSPVFFNNINLTLAKLRMIPADIHNLPLMASIAKELKINGIISTPTILDFFLDYLKKNSFDLNSIKWVSLGGEFCSIQKYQHFKAALPNAVFLFRYGSSEIEGKRFYRCEHLTSNASPNVFHPVPTAGLLEIIDENGNILPLGEFGEIIHTDLKPKAFPMIRYKTKDIGSLSKKECPCGNNIILTMGGRADFDIMKFQGVTLSAEMIARALQGTEQDLEPKFQMHVYEEKIGSKIKPQLEIHLKLKNNSFNAEENPIFTEIIKEKISANLLLSAKATLKTLVGQDVFLPLKITFVKEWQQNQHKTKNIISHLE